MNELEFQIYLKKINNGDKNALKNIYDAYGYAVYAYALSIVKDKHIAEDISQEVFIKIWNNSSKFKKKYNPKAWIMTITRNSAIDYLRKYSKEHTVSEVNVEESRDMESEINYRLSIQQAMTSLNEEEREIIILHTISDLTFKTIGELIGKPLGTITWRYREGIKKLKKRITL